MPRHRRTCRPAALPPRSSRRAHGACGPRRRIPPLPRPVGSNRRPALLPPRARRCVAQTRRRRLRRSRTITRCPDSEFGTQSRSTRIAERARAPFRVGVRVRNRPTVTMGNGVNLEPYSQTVRQTLSSSRRPPSPRATSHSPRARVLPPSNGSSPDMIAILSTQSRIMMRVITATTTESTKKNRRRG